MREVQSAGDQGGAHPLACLLHLGVGQPHQEARRHLMRGDFDDPRHETLWDAMAGLDIDVAGEYLLMAATLCHIKSRELLPSSEPLEEDAETAAESGDEVEIDPRADLIKRLLEYQKYKEAADQLGQRPVVGLPPDVGERPADRGTGDRARAICVPPRRSRPRGSGSAAPSRSPASASPRRPGPRTRERSSAGPRRSC